jgi:hypothetical protein
LEVTVTSRWILQCQPAEAIARYAGDVYIQHNPGVAGADLMQRWLQRTGFAGTEVLAAKLKSAGLLLRQVENMAEESSATRVLTPDCRPWLEHRRSAYYHEPRVKVHEVVDAALLTRMAGCGRIPARRMVDET